MFEPKKILVPTDFSEHSDKALKQALDIAEKYNAKIFLLHVIDKDIQQCGGYYCLPQEQMDAFKHEIEVKSEEMMNEEVSRIPHRPHVEIEYDIKKGVPYDEILKEQDNKDVDLIVIASHGRTGFLSRFIGSVADRVTEHAKKPVLLVRA